MELEKNKSSNKNGNSLPLVAVFFTGLMLLSGFLLIISGINPGVGFKLSVFSFIGLVASYFLYLLKQDEFMGEKYKHELLQFLQKNNFQLTKKVEIELDKLWFCVDSTNNKFALVTYDHENKDNHTLSFSITQYNFSDLIDFELLEDYDEQIQGRAMAATAGALLFGPAGAIIGSSGRRNVSKTNRSIVINLHVNNLSTPLVSIFFPMLYGYEHCIDNAQKIKSILLLIKRKNEENNIKTTNTSNDNIEKIKQLKELFDQNIITEEEFNNKKKELLDNL